MGDNPESAVVDVEGQVFGHKGLYVIDGAILHGATGGNPSLTIAAIAERCIETAVRRITGTNDWMAPERADAPRRRVPEDAAVRAVVARGPRRPATPGIRISEVMRGSLTQPRSRSAAAARVTMKLNGAIPDLRIFLDDPVDAAELTGTIEVVSQRSSPTKSPAPISRPTTGRSGAIRRPYPQT